MFFSKMVHSKAIECLERSLTAGALCCSGRKMIENDKKTRLQKWLHVFAPSWKLSASVSASQPGPMIICIFKY